MAGRGGRTGASRREDMLRALMQQQSGPGNPLASRPAADQPVEPKGSMQETLEEPASVSEPLQGSPLMQQEGPTPSRGLAGSPQDAISQLVGGGADQLPESLGQMDPRRRKLLEMLQQMGAGQQMQR